MRLLTRSDFDGLACAVLLKQAGVIDSYKFIHPKDLQDGLVEVTENDCLANVPYVEGCGLWFDHHSSEVVRDSLKGKFKGECRTSPSTAHIIYDYYGGEATFPGMEALLYAVDKVDSADLTVDDILHPYGWVLLGFIMDPRTGLGRYHHFRISNYQLMEKLIDWCAQMDIHEILELPDVKERVDLYNSHSQLFVEMLKKHIVIRDDIIITDLRGVDPIYVGNRFIIYTLFPDQNISVWIADKKDGDGCMVAVGHSIINRTSNIDVGTLMLKYGGGGHHEVGTCQFTKDEMDEKIKQLIDNMVKLNK